MTNEQFTKEIEARLKPLVWEEHKNQSNAECEVGEYLITLTDRIDITLYANGRAIWETSDFFTEIRAKAACEADRLKRVLDMFKEKEDVS